MQTCPRCLKVLAAGFVYCPYDGQYLADGPAGAPPREEGTGEKIGRFRVRRLLGEGSMGRVFQAYDPDSERDVAIKVLDGAQARTAEGAERFLREVKHLRSIRHDNVLRVFEAALCPDGSPFLVMEYLEGESLGAHLRRSPLVPIPLAVRVALDVARGVNAAHGLGMIHRDVKPDNVFLVGELGAPSAIKVLDFGLARVTGTSRLTANGVIVGTVEYMSPEQAVGDPTGMRSDIYALGVMIFRMVTGRLPFLGSTSAILAQQLTHPTPPPTSLNPDVPAGLERVVLGATRKLPRNRYTSMDDVIADLERVAGEREGDVSADFVPFEDVYEPQTAFSKSIAQVLTRKAATLRG